MKRYILPVWLLLCVSNAQAQPAAATPDKNTLVQYFENQEYARAVDYLKPISGEDPGNMHNLSLLGYAYYMSNQLSQAGECYSRIFASDSGNARACNYLGKINLLKGDKARALFFFCRLADLKHGVAGYYKQLATLWEKLNNPAAAAYYYRLAYQANPLDPDVVAGLAGHWIGQEMSGPADSILDIALQGDSLQAEVVKMKVLSAYRQKQYKVIFPLVDLLKKMDNVMLHPFLYAAIGYYTTHQYQKCAETCDFMITHHLKTRTVLYLEALAFEQQKKYAHSLAMLNECISMAVSKDADGYFLAKGEIYEALHQYHAAVRQYDTAYYMFQNPLQLYNKGRIYDTKLKSPRTALHYYNEYLRRRRKPLPEDEKPVLKYVDSRVKALKAWEKGH